MGSYPVHKNYSSLLLIKINKILFLNSTIIGTLVTASSHSWLIIWLGIEINLLSIIPTFVRRKNSYPRESAIKYFINQSLASTIFIISIIILERPLNQTNIITTVAYTRIYLSIFLKLGIAPLHRWFPEVIEGLRWNRLFILLTWQKIAPIIIIITIIKPSIIIFIFIIFSSITGGILGLNQIRVRKIIAYSSINHIAWISISLIRFSKIWLIYFITYSATNLFLVIVFSRLKIYFINQIKSLKLNKTSSLIIIINFLSLGGLPPFIGFIPKWLTILFIIKLYNFIIPRILIIFTLLSIYIYLRITFSSFIIKTCMSNISLKYKINFSLIFLNIIFLIIILPSNIIF